MLWQFQAKLGELTFFDFACDCGNCLIISYRELRVHETTVPREVSPNIVGGRQMNVFTTELSCIDADQIHGIEIGDFPARIAETEQRVMDHIIKECRRLPLEKTKGRTILTQRPNSLKRSGC